MLGATVMSGCFYGPFISDDPPVNCPYEEYRWDNLSSDAPTATVLRNNVMVDVMGTIDDLGSAPLTVDIYTVDCDGVPVAHTTSSESFHHWQFTLSGANAGETLYIDGQYHGPVKAADTCSTMALAPMPQCSGMYDWSICEGSGSGSGSDTVTPPGDDDTGCNASGASGLAMIAVVLAAIIVRRRRN
jgi:uncharacterized protein (TIGR03382 family)